MPFSTFDHLRLKLWLKFWLLLEPIKFLQPHFLNATFENVISSNPRRVAEFARRKKAFVALDFSLFQSLSKAFYLSKSLKELVLQL